MTETGGLFRMLFKLIEARSTLDLKPDLTGVMTLLGRYFQMRDDYLNLTSADVSSPLKRILPHSNQSISYMRADI